MSDLEYTKRQLERVENLPKDYPNKSAIIGHWIKEYDMERKAIKFDREYINREYIRKLK